MINDVQKDVLRELVNIGVAKGGAILADLMGVGIKLKVPEVTIIPYKELSGYYNRNAETDLFTVVIGFRGGYEGLAGLILEEEDSHALAASLLKVDINSPELKVLEEDILKEVGNIVLNAVMNTFANMIKIPFAFNIPKSFHCKYETLFEKITADWSGEDAIICKANFNVEYGKGMRGEIILLSDTIFEYIKDYSR